MYSIFAIQYIHTIEELNYLPFGSRPGQTAYPNQPGTIVIKIRIVQNRCRLIIGMLVAILTVVCTDAITQIALLGKIYEKFAFK